MKKTGKEVVLTSQNLEEAGIKTALNQNDLIDIIVADKVEKVLGRAKFLEERLEEIYKRYLAPILAQKEKFLKELIDAAIVPADFTAHQISWGFQEHPKIAYTIPYVKITENPHSKVEGMLSVNNASRYTIAIDPFSAKLYVTVKKKEDVPSGIKGVTLDQTVTSIYEKVFSVTAKALEPIKVALAEHETEVNEFRSLFPDGSFNPNKIARESRTRMNRNILKNQAPSIVEELNSVFGLGI